MARTQNIKKNYGEKGSPLTIYNGALHAWFVSLQSISHKAPVVSLSHRWSLIRPHPVRRGKGSAVASLSLSLIVGH